MTLGCSTHLVGVADSETYPARLQHYLTEAGYGNVEVVNAGQPWHTSFQGDWLWDALWMIMPDVVLVGYIVQDARKAAYSDKSVGIYRGQPIWKTLSCIGRKGTKLSIWHVCTIQAKERSSQDEGGRFVYRLKIMCTWDHWLQRFRVQERNFYLDSLKGLGTQNSIVWFCRLQHKNWRWVTLIPRSNGIAAPESRLYFARDKGHANAAGNDQIARWVFEYLNPAVFPSPKPEW